MNTVKILTIAQIGFLCPKCHVTHHIQYDITHIKIVKTTFMINCPNCSIELKEVLNG